MKTKIDYTKPVETDTTPPRPVRIAKSFYWGDEKVHLVEMPDGLPLIFTDHGKNAPLGLSLRNVPPPKPEPVRYEVWISLYANGGTATTLTNNTHPALGYEPVHCRRIAWMSDGSPVPGEDDPVRYGVCETCVEKAVKRCDELVAERDALKAELARMKAEAADYVRRMTAERDVLKAEVKRQRAAHDHHTDRLMDQVNRANYYRKLAEEDAERRKPVYDAAVAWASRGLTMRDPWEGAVFEAVRAAEAAKLSEPVKSCRTCWHDDGVYMDHCRKTGCSDAELDNFPGWEAKSHD